MDYQIVEELNENHLNALHNLFKEEWWTQKRQLSDLRKLVDNSSLVVALINTETEELIGFARVISDSLYRAFIFDVITDKRYRNLGIGTMLLNYILEHRLIREVERVELYCPDKLVPYYEKFGFSTAGSNLMRYKKI